jgi:nucleoid-associated protein EbfC
MQVRGGINELMRQAARIQRKVEQVKTECKDKEVTASAVGDKVKATVSLGKKLNRIEIDPEFMKAESFDLVLDGVCAAVNAGFDDAEKALQAEIDKVTGGVKIPGLT